MRIDFGGNIDSIVSDKISKSGAGKKLSEEMKRKMADEAAEAFIACLNDVIRSKIGSNYGGGEISVDAAEQITNLDHGVPRKSSESIYTVDVWFNVQGRPSLNPHDQLDNLVNLLNDGYSSVKHRISGEWKGQIILNLPSRGGAHFIEDAIEEFKNKYASTYNVIRISRSID